MELEDAVSKAVDSDNPFDLLNDLESFDWKAGGGGVACFEHVEAEKIVLVREDGAVMKVETSFENLVNYLKSKVEQ